MVSLLVNPDRLESFRQVGARPGQRRRARQELNQKTNLLANTGLDTSGISNPGWVMNYTGCHHHRY